MPTNEETADTIQENAQGAESFTSDGQSAKQVPIQDQIAAAKFAAAQRAKRKPFRFIKMVPPDGRGEGC